MAETRILPFITLSAQVFRHSGYSTNVSKWELLGKN